MGNIIWTLYVHTYVDRTQLDNIYNAMQVERASVGKNSIDGPLSIIFESLLI